MIAEPLIEKVLTEALKNAKQWKAEQNFIFPLITKSGTNQSGHKIHYFLNYSAENAKGIYPFKTGKELLSDLNIEQNSIFNIQPWGVIIVEEN